MCHVFYDILWRRGFIAGSPRRKSGSAMKKRIEKKKMQKVNEIVDSCDQWGSALRYSNLRDKLASDGFTEMIGSQNCSGKKSPSHPAVQDGLRVKLDEFWMFFHVFPCFSGRLWKDNFPRTTASGKQTYWSLMSVKPEHAVPRILLLFIVIHHSQISSFV